MIVKGQKVNDRYEIIKSIGEGGMANVYLAKDTILDRMVAIKVLRGDLANDEKFVRRFQREALSASSLSHPNIVEMYDVGEDNGDYYIVMEYVEGKTLKQLIKKRGALTVTEVVDIMLQVTDAMTLAHENLIIHRDLKPQNIMIMEDGGIKITDFGIAMALNSTQLTQTNSVMGSVHYLPPEQANGKGSTLKSDVYSLGIMMYELLIGKLPFRGDNAVEIALKHMKEVVPSVRRENSSIPQSIENIITKATSKNPKNRYSSAKEMYDDLKTCLNKERVNEPKIKLRYSEHDNDDTKILKLTEENNLEESLVKEIKPDDDEKSTKKIVVLGIIFGILALIAMGILLFTIFFKGNSDVKIPDVSSLTVVDAEEKLKDTGFDVNIKTEDVSSDTIEKGLVVKTSPAIGRTVKKGSKITLYVSTGAATYKIEDYTGKNYIEVKTLLESVYGIVVTVEKKDVDQTVKEYDEQEIIGQNVEKDTELKKGDAIILYIPNLVAIYPDMVKEKWLKADVEAFAKKYNLVVSYSYQENDTLNEGTVLSQSREAKTPVITGSTFRVTLSQKPVVEEPTTPEDNIGNE